MTVDSADIPDTVLRIDIPVKEGAEFSETVFL